MYVESLISSKFERFLRFLYFQGTGIHDQQQSSRTGLENRPSTPKPGFLQTRKTVGIGRETSALRVKSETPVRVRPGRTGHSLQGPAQGLH